MLPVYYLGLPILLATVLLLSRFLKKKVLSKKEQLKQSLKKSLKGTPYNNTAQFWADVSAMETGGFTSPLYVFRKNPWGMKTPKTRQTKALPGLDTWARYNSIQDATDDILLWMKARGFRPANNIAGHVKEMQRVGYFAGETWEEYLTKVLAWKERMP